MSTSTARDEAEPQILHRDRRLLVVHKPPGIATTAPAGGPSLFAWAQDVDPAAPHLHPTSRLDSSVSGLVLFARTREANHAVLAARRQHRYVRLYVGLLSGVPVPGCGTWDGAIAVSSDDPRRRVVVREGDRTSKSRARAAQTRYETVTSVTGITLVRLWPQTGRTHQLRVHCSHAGVPLLGDHHYGGPRRAVMADGSVIAAHRPLLHCAGVRIAGLGEYAAPVPPDVVAVWESVGGNPGDLTAAARLVA